LLHAHLSGGDDYVFAILLLKLLRLLCAPVVPSLSLQFAPSLSAGESGPLSVCDFVAAAGFVLLGIAFYFVLIEVAAIIFFPPPQHPLKLTHMPAVCLYCRIYVLPVFAILIKNVFITAQNADE